MTTQSALKNYTDCGVYTITHNTSGKVYVGSSACIIKRKSRHLKTLQRNNHTNDYLQNAWNKYDADAFTFKVVIVCPPDDRIFHEQRLIDQYDSANRQFGYNSSSIAGVTEITPETKEKMRKAKLGKSPVNKGVPHTEETKEKISAANKGRSPPNKGNPMPAHVKESLRQSQLGRIVSDETKERLSKAHKKTHCKRGHEFTVENAYIKKPRKGRESRGCRICIRDHYMGVKTS